ncbi:shikimate kinase [Nocardia sp. NPDC059239]|uniref:shikimate kinase n=1 Tax=unclassified Nocardia TaxID=2637762 RepID=UPI00367AF6C3
MILVGPPGAGKTTVGRLLADRVGVSFRDTDDLIREATGCSIPEIFAERGEAEFRRIEEDMVRGALATRGGVLSLGGGAVLSAATRALLRDRIVVCLDVGAEEGLRRVVVDSDRPLFSSADRSAHYADMLRRRQPLYREIARLVVGTDGRIPEEVVRRVLAELGSRSPSNGAAKAG